ncbi:hypothetical protein AGATL06_28150 [Agathobaculum sp. TL06]
MFGYIAHKIGWKRKKKAFDSYKSGIARKNMKMVYYIHNKAFATQEGSNKEVSHVVPYH